MPELKKILTLNCEHEENQFQLIETDTDIAIARLKRDCIVNPGESRLELNLVVRVGNSPASVAHYYDLQSQYLKDKVIYSLGRDLELDDPKFYIDKLHDFLEKIEMASTTQGSKLSKLDEEIILKVQADFKQNYEEIWKSLTTREKIVLFDFAEDGFTNYRAVDTLRSLICKGVLVYRKSELLMMNNSFRNFVLTMLQTPEGEELKKEMQHTERWDILRIILFVTTLGALIFVFFTQHDALPRITAGVTSIGAIISLLFRFIEQRNVGAKSTT